MSWIDNPLPDAAFFSTSRILFLASAISSSANLLFALTRSNSILKNSASLPPFTASSHPGLDNVLSMEMPPFTSCAVPVRLFSAITLAMQLISGVRPPCCPPTTCSSRYRTFQRSALVMITIFGWSSLPAIIGEIRSTELVVSSIMIELSIAPAFSSPASLAAAQ